MVQYLYYYILHLTKSIAQLTPVLALTHWQRTILNKPRCDEQLTATASCTGGIKHHLFTIILCGQAREHVKVAKRLCLLINSC
jgi:hypothetical protein